MAARQHSSSSVAAPHAQATTPLNEPGGTGMVNAIGVVTGALPGGVYSVLSDTGQVLRCIRAASCLLRPALNDLVLVSGPDALRLYLTAVVEQANAAESSIDVVGDLRLSSERGAVTIESPGRVALKGQQGVSLRGAELEMAADTANCRIGRLQYQGEEAHATVLSVRLIGRFYEAVMDRLVHLSKTAFRMTEEVEHVRASQLDYQASDTARLHGKNTIVTAGEIVKADGKQIHIG
ncbi:DUF3540 domain-containing protein [Variovorax sp. RB3P1]|uniref:DUF3540 domain-containing protein n=1 Tax=Variovorax sp. RB3P1 TaxID=3443732 RepID=UPI003F4493CA